MADIKIVESCPTSIKEMYEAANDMKCAEFAARKNCSNIKYHCVINEYTNETLEVCAPNRFIFGNADKALYCLSNRWYILYELMYLSFFFTF